MPRRLSADSDRRQQERPVFSSHLASALVTMAREGRGVVWAPRSLVDADLASGRLARVGGPDEEVTIEIRIFRPKARQPRPAESFWHRVVRERDSRFPTMPPQAITL